MCFSSSLLADFGLDLLSVLLTACSSLPLPSPHLFPFKICSSFPPQTHSTFTPLSAFEKFSCFQFSAMLSWIFPQFQHQVDVRGSEGKKGNVFYRMNCSWNLEQIFKVNGCADNLIFPFVSPWGWLVGFVSRITQKLLKGFWWNLYGGWISAQNRHPLTFGVDPGTSSHFI